MQRFVFFLTVALVFAGNDNGNNGNGNGNGGSNGNGNGKGNGGGLNPWDVPSCSGVVPILPCLQVSEAPSFVTCVPTTTNPDGPAKCACKPDFNGNASLVNKCRCDSPKQVYFQLGTSQPLNSAAVSDSSSASVLGLLPAEWGVVSVRCVDLVGLEGAAAKNEKHKNSVVKFFNNTIFPTPAIILANPNALLDILSPNVKSRISPAGSFNGFMGVVEYFYGFVAIPGNIVKSVDIRSIAASGNTVAAKANILVNNTQSSQTLGFPPALFNLSIFSFFTFDNNDKIASIDVSVPNLGKLLDATSPPLPAAAIAAVQQARIDFTCQILSLPSALSTNTSGTCGWLNPFNVSTPQIPTAQFGACRAFMATIPFGSWNRINSNTVVCRFLHALLTPYGPDVHCPHTSPSGGGACIEFTYESFFQEEY